MREIIYCDVYGNLISNIPASLLEGRALDEVRIRGRTISRLSRTFLDPNAGASPELIALFGSHGYLEVAVPGGQRQRTTDRRAWRAGFRCLHLRVIRRPGTCRVW